MASPEYIEPPSSVSISGPLPERGLEILSPDALKFLSTLHRRFEDRRRRVLEDRVDRQLKLDDGFQYDFLRETLGVREREWLVAHAPSDLRDRRVEITGPVDRKTIINALNCGANVFMADFEDSATPTWSNMIQGQINLKDAVNGTIEFNHPETGKRYALAERTATLVVRPRGWHLLEKHLHIDGEPISASLFDFALYLFHNYEALLERRTGPYFYLPKLESHLEARLWNDVIVSAQQALGLPLGTVATTVLIETLPAAFEMEEILFELRDHCVGLNCGRWDYIFSFIKKFRLRSELMLPDRAQLTMDRPFLSAYVELLISTCHRRGAYAIGGMAAQIPIKDQPEANSAALEKVRVDKVREAKAGHDGTWVAHPGLVPVAKDAFSTTMNNTNQLNRLRKDIDVSAVDLLAIPDGEITDEGFRSNIRVGIQYLEAWLRGQGCVPINNLMEDAATAEICRAQVWQWLQYGAKTSDDRRIDRSRFNRTRLEELERIAEEVGADRFENGRYALASALFTETCTRRVFDEFLTLPAYEHIE